MVVVKFDKIGRKKAQKLCFFYGAYDGTRTHDLSLTNLPSAKIEFCSAY